MKEIRVIGIYVQNRLVEASEIQGLLTKYGCNIKTRLGLHTMEEGACAADGLIILELTGPVAECDALEAGLSACKGVKLQKMIFN
jgi:hypothetical protein